MGRKHSFVLQIPGHQKNPVPAGKTGTGINVFDKPNEQSQAPLELCHGEKTAVFIPTSYLSTIEDTCAIESTLNALPTSHPENAKQSDSFVLYLTRKHKEMRDIEAQKEEKTR